MTGRIGRRRAAAAHDIRIKLAGAGNPGGLVRLLSQMRGMSTVRLADDDTD